MPAAALSPGHGPRRARPGGRGRAGRARARRHRAGEQGKGPEAGGAAGGRRAAHRARAAARRGAPSGLAGSVRGACGSRRGYSPGRASLSRKIIWNSGELPCPDTESRIRVVSRQRRRAGYVRFSNDSAGCRAETVKQPGKASSGGPGLLRWARNDDVGPSPFPIRENRTAAEGGSAAVRASAQAEEPEQGENRDCRSPEQEAQRHLLRIGAPDRKRPDGAVTGP